MRDEKTITYGRGLKPLSSNAFDSKYNYDNTIFYDPKSSTTTSVNKSTFGKAAVRVVTSCLTARLKYCSRDPPDDIQQIHVQTKYFACFLTSCMVLQTEFSTVYKTKPNEMSNPQKLEEYRKRWTRDIPGPLRDQRFETENTFVNDRAAGQGSRVSRVL